MLPLTEPVDWLNAWIAAIASSDEAQKSLLIEMLDITQYLFTLNFEDGRTPKGDKRL